MALEDLRSFTGSENYYRHAINKKMIYTDGAMYVAEDGGAFWLLDEIAIANMFEDSLKAEDFQNWSLEKIGNTDSANLVADNGNGKVLFSKKIEFTDFPLDGIQFYVVAAEDFGAGIRMIMLHSEY